MADFVQKANVKRLVCTLTTPIADVATLNTIVQGVIATNAFECVDHVVSGVTIAGITRGTQSFGINVVYENPTTLKNMITSTAKASTVATEIRPYKNFYPAEEYHQNYASKKPREYELYKTYSGRKAFIDKVWGIADKVKVYSTPHCHNCHEIKEFLPAKHVEFEEIDLVSNDVARAMIIEQTGHLGAPIVQIGNEFIFGYDPKKMESLLK